MGTAIVLPLFRLMHDHTIRQADRRSCHARRRARAAPAVATLRPCFRTERIRPPAAESQTPTEAAMQPSAEQAARSREYAAAVSLNLEIGLAIARPPAVRYVGPDANRRVPRARCRSRLRS